MKVIWMPQALKGLDEVIGFLERRWGDEQIIQLGTDIEHFIERVIAYPDSCVETAHRAGVKKGFPNPHTYMVFRIDGNVMEILNFRSTRQLPQD